MPAKCVLIVLLCVVTAAFTGCRARPDTGPDTVAKLQAKINQNFKDSQSHYELGKLYQAQGNYDKASYEYNIALNFDPVNRDAQASTVKAFRLAGNEQGATEAAAKYVKQVSFAPEDSIALGRAFEQQDISDYALMSYEQAVKLTPNSAIPYKELGKYYLNKKDRDTAKTYFLRSFELDPYQPEVGYELGRLGVIVKVPQAPPAAPAPAKPVKK